MKIKALIALALICLAAVPAYAVQRRVLIEDFTNYNCPPCDAIEDSMNSIFSQFLSSNTIIPLRPHVWWPAQGQCDPMWLSDQPDVSTRVTYYAVNYVPTFRYDGALRIDPSDYGTYAAYYAAVWSNINARYNTPAAVSINITSLYKDDTTLYCNFTVTYAEAVEAVGATQQVYMAAMESNHNYPALGGKEYFIHRGFGEECGPSGTQIALANVGDSQSFQWTFRFDDRPVAPCPQNEFGSEENPNKLAVVIWVQKNAGVWTQRNVLNSAYESLASLTDVPSPMPASRFELAQNTPNPFNPSQQQTTIAYSLDRAGAVKLSVYDLSGRLVNELVNEHMAEGTHGATWNGLDRRGNPASSGIYYYRLESPAKSQTRKITLIR